MKALALIQARMGSRRFPGKVLQDLAGRPVLAHVIERCQAIPGIDQVALTIPQGPEDDPLADWAVDHGIACHRSQVPLPGTGANDCLGAYQAAAYALGADVILRITADCPLLSPEVAGEVVRVVRERQAPMASNCSPRTFPDGCDAEAFTAPLLAQAAAEATALEDREHVTPWMHRRASGPALWCANLEYPGDDWSAIRWTIDTPDDLVKLRKIAAHLAPRAFMLWDTRKAAEAAGEWP